MTPVSIVVGCLAAMACGLIAGRCLRGFRAGDVLAHAIAVAVGLIVLQSSQWSDLVRTIQPKLASDWLPAICIVFSICAVIRPWKYRFLCGIALALLTPVRLLWGSVYLPPETSNSSVVLCLATWSAALAVPVLFSNDAFSSRMGGRAVTWGVAIAATSALLTLSGSLTYGAATGVCGLAILGVLLSTSRIPGTAAIPMICLIGLTTTFAELPVLTGGLMLLVWIAVVLADRMPTYRAAIRIRTTAAVLLVLTGSLTYNRIMSDTDGTGAAGYNSSVLEIPEESTQRHEDVPPASTMPKQSNADDVAMDPTDDAAGPVDPFGGLPIE